jgi:hypothetical protein
LPQDRSERFRHDVSPTRCFEIPGDQAVVALKVDALRCRYQAFPMRRVSIVGAPGSDEATVGWALSGAMSVPFVELDKLSISPAEANPPSQVPGAQSRDDNGAAVGHTSVPTGVAMRGKSAIHRDRA